MATINKTTVTPTPTSTVETENKTTAQSSTSTADAAMVYATTLMVGTFLGILFTKSEVVRWQRINDMFLFQDSHFIPDYWLGRCRCYVGNVHYPKI